MDWEEVGGMSCGETLINPSTPRRVMETAYPYVLADSIDKLADSIDKVVVRLKLPYVMASRWRKLVRKILRMDRVDTSASYVW